MKELMQVRFAKADPNELATWIQCVVPCSDHPLCCIQMRQDPSLPLLMLPPFRRNWPKGGVKDAYGLPKLMLPVSSEKKGAGLKIIFKGSLDPWLQVSPSLLCRPLLDFCI